jgi:hypothetical protein
MSFYNRGGNDPFQDPHPDGETYDPAGYEAVKSAKTLSTIIYVIIGIVAVIVWFSNLGSSSNRSESFEEGQARSQRGFIEFGAVIAVGIGFGLLYGSHYKGLLEEHERNVAVEKERRNASLATELKQTKASLEEAKEIMNKQTGETEKIQAANRMGDIIFEGIYAPVTITDSFKQSVHVVSETDPGLASAIKTLGGYIEESKNKEAGEYFERLHKMIASKEEDKTITKSLWHSITSALPSVLELTDVVAKIESVFQGGAKS